MQILEIMKNRAGKDPDSLLIRAFSLKYLSRTFVVVRKF